MRETEHRAMRGGGQGTGEREAGGRGAEERGREGAVRQRQRGA